MTLLQADVGKRYVLRSIWLQRDITRRLQMLGMTPGVCVAVLNRKRSGSVIIKVRGARFALGPKFAQGRELEECSRG